MFERNKTVYGCSDVTGQTHRLGSAGFCNNSDRVGAIALNGAMAAYGVERCGVDTGTTLVVVRRLTDGKLLRTAPATAEVPGPESYQSVGSVVVKPGGAVAWIGEAQSIIRHGTMVVEVHRADRHGQAELDQGAGIAPGSLRLNGSRLTWTHSGRQRSTTLG